MASMETPDAVAGRSQGGKTRAVDNRRKKKDQYCSYYDFELELEEVEETEAESEARIRAKLCASFETRLAGTATGNDPASSDEEEEFGGSPEPEEEVPVPADGEYQTQQGACEAVLIWMKRSQTCLIAMCQGLIMSRPYEVYPGTYVFDMDRDKLLKAFPQKALFFPTVKVLKEEAQ
jgi:hypothetical protein